jgi:L-fucose isomerase-like protein
MLKTKIGFVPSTWESWDGNQYTGKWAVKMRQRCLDSMSRIEELEIVVPSPELTEDGCVGTPEEGAKTLELFKKENVQGVIIGNMNFGHETSVGVILSGLPKDMPILHFATRSGPISEKGNRSTDTWCGQFMTASAIKRRGFIFEHIRTCNPEDERFLEGIDAFVRACTAISRFKGARILQIGTRPTGFESQFFSEEKMQRDFGQMLIPVNQDDEFEYIDAISPNDPETINLAQEIRASVGKVTEELPDSLINQARLEIALKRMMKDFNADAMAVTCWERLQKNYHIAACSTFARLNNQGIIVACEVDVLGAITMLIMNSCAMGRTPATFIDWTDLHPTEENVWLAWHCGNAPCQLCADGQQMLLTQNERLAIWGPTCHGALEFRMKSGPVTCARMVEYNNEYSMFYGTGELLNIGPMSRGAYGWVKVNDVGAWEDKMIETGVIHHGVLIHDPKVANALRLFCKFTGIKAVRGA